VSDQARQEVLIVGGQTPGFAIWDGSGWRHPQQTLRPSRRSELALAYDETRQRVVLFGGRSLLTGSELLADTWEWDGSDWREIPSANSPPARERHAMAYDPISARVLLFGGEGIAGSLADTWTWDGSNWTELAPQASPPATHGHAMVSETMKNRVILCGGLVESAIPEGSAGGTWAWDGNDWLELGSAPESQEHAMAYDPIRGRCVLFGGQAVPSSGGNPTLLAKTWEWDGSSWTEMFPPDSPRPMSEHAMAFDYANGRIISVNENLSYDPGPMADMWDYFVPQAMPDLQPFGTGCGGDSGVLELYPWHAYWPWIGEVSYLYVLPQPLPGSNNTFGLIGASKDFDANLGVSLPYDLAVIGMPGCPLLVSTDRAVTVRTGGTFRFWALSIPDEMSLLGMHFFLQGYTLDPAANLNGVVVSNGLEAVIGLR
jgi:hypothetical protein